MHFQLCMPPQQISPSAASRSPWSLATLAPSRNVSAISLGVVFGVFFPIRHARRRIDAHDAVRPHAQLAELCRDPAGLGHRRDPILPLGFIAHRRRRQTTPARRPSRPQIPWREFCRPDSLMPSSLISIEMCGSKRKRSTPSNFTPFTSALAVSSSIVSRLMAVPPRGRPCRRGRATWRCEFGVIVLAHGGAILRSVKTCSCGKRPSPGRRDSPRGRSSAGTRAARSRWCSRT